MQGIPFVGDIPIHYWADQGTLLWTMLIAMGFAELRRLQVWAVAHVCVAVCGCVHLWDGVSTTLTWSRRTARLSI